MTNFDHGWNGFGDEHEAWKPVVNWDGRYYVSDKGRVVSVRWVKSRNEFTVRVLKPRQSHKGHLRVALCRDGQCLDARVHVLVLEAFVGSRPEGMVARHWNDNPVDNRVENLLWGTYSDNLNDCVRNGNHAFASRTKCLRGHSLSGHNLVLSGKQRVCRACRSARRKTYRGSPESVEALSDHFYKEYVEIDAQSDQLESC